MFAFCFSCLMYLPQSERTKLWLSPVKTAISLFEHLNFAPFFFPCRQVRATNSAYYCMAFRSFLLIQILSKILHYKIEPANVLRFLRPYFNATWHDYCLFSRTELFLLVWCQIELLTCIHTALPKRTNTQHFFGQH